MRLLKSINIFTYEVCIPVIWLNWQCHKDTMEFYNPLNISNEERDKLIKAQLKRKMRTSPDDYEVTCINEIHWLKYSIKNTINKIND